MICCFRLKFTASDFLFQSLKWVFTKKVFCYECYKITENVNRSGYWYCLCNLYIGCQTEKGFITNTGRYCPVCQFEGTYDLDELNHVKEDLRKLQTYYYDILGQICEVKKIDGTNDFWEEEVRYSQYCSLKHHVDYLFDL